MSLKPLDLTLVEQKDIVLDTWSWIKNNMSQFSENTKHHEVTAFLNTKLAETIATAIPGAQYKTDEDANNEYDTSGVLLPTCDETLMDNYNVGISFESYDTQTQTVSWDSTSNSIRTKRDALEYNWIDKISNIKLSSENFRGRAIVNNSARPLNVNTSPYTYSYDYASALFMMRYWKYTNLYMLSAPAYSCGTQSSETTINTLKAYKFGPTLIFTKLYDKLKQSYVHCCLELNDDTTDIYAYIEGVSSYIRIIPMYIFGTGSSDINKQDRVLHAKQLIIGGRYYSESLFIVDSKTFPLVPNNITDVTNPFDKNAGFFTIDNKKFVALQTMLGDYGASLAAYIGDV